MILILQFLDLHGLSSLPVPSPNGSSQPLIVSCEQDWQCPCKCFAGRLVTDSMGLCSVLLQCCILKPPSPLPTLQTICAYQS